MFIHAKELSRLGFKKFVIVSVDSGVIVISLYAYWFLDIEELWVEFGFGKDRRWLPIHQYAKTLGKRFAWLYHFGLHLRFAILSRNSPAMDLENLER